MKLTSIKTHKITVEDKNIFQILDTYIPSLEEGSVVAITSKIVSICEGSVVKIGKIDKKELVKKQSDFYLSEEESKYGFVLTVKDSSLSASAGIDESNGNGYFVLWPKDPQKSANGIRDYLRKKFSLKQIGVVITDSKTTPLRWGVTGFTIAHSGFAALNDYIGKPDIFGRVLHATKVNIMDGLGASAVLVMGEGNEQTPICIIEDIPNIEFKDHNPTPDELESLKIDLEDDLYAPILKNTSWEKGGSG